MGGQNFHVFTCTHNIWSCSHFDCEKRDGATPPACLFHRTVMWENYHTKMIHDGVLFLVFGSQKLTALGFCLAWYKQSVKKIYIINFHRQRISIKHKT